MIASKGFLVLLVITVWNGILLDIWRGMIDQTYESKPKRVMCICRQERQREKSQQWKRYHVVRLEAYDDIIRQQRQKTKRYYCYIKSVEQVDISRKTSYWSSASSPLPNKTKLQLYMWSERKITFSTFFFRYFSRSRLLDIIRSMLIYIPGDNRTSSSCEYCDTDDMSTHG